MTSDTAKLETSQTAPAMSTVKPGGATQDGTASGAENGLSIEFLANLAHQLRSPLSSLRVWVDLLGDPGAVAGPDDMKRLMEGIDRATSRLERQISDVLDAGYLETGMLSVETDSIDAMEQLIEAVAGAEHAARSRRISFDLKFGDQPVTILANPDRLHQILCNLISNAVRFSPVGGTITLTTGSTARIAGDSSVTTVLEPRFEGQAHYVCISDTGPGIAPGLHSEVFKPFHRSVPSGTRGGGGSGLGLAIAIGLLKLHLGGMWLRSSVNNGAEFEFSLPSVPDATKLAEPVAPSGADLN